LHRATISFFITITAQTSQIIMYIKNIMKKFFILLCVAAVFSVAGYSQTYRYDVNGDGVVTISDVLLINYN
jgi:hypothetical protein